MTHAQPPSRPIGRNEPCPCGSRKKYKRCCGMSAAPQLGTPKQPQGSPPFDPSTFANMDPNLMMQMTQALQRLPKGQLQRLQSIMQKAMAGKDVSDEAAEFEKTLSPDFLNLIGSFQIPNTGAGGNSVETEMAENENFKQYPDIDLPISADQTSDGSVATPQEMTEDQARALIIQAVAEGKITKEQAEELLKK